MITPWSWSWSPCSTNSDTGCYISFLAASSFTVEASQGKIWVRSELRVLPPACWQCRKAKHKKLHLILLSKPACPSGSHTHTQTTQIWIGKQCNMTILPSMCSIPSENRRADTYQYKSVNETKTTHELRDRRRVNVPRSTVVSRD